MAAQQKRKQSGISAGWVLQLKKTWHLDDCLTTQGEGTYIRPWFYVEWLGEEINRSRFHSSDAGWQDNRNFMYAPDIFKFGETVQVQLSCQYSSFLVGEFPVIFPKELFSADKKAPSIPKKLRL